MKTQQVKTVTEYAAAVGPHAKHETYRADRPFDRLIGKGCKTCSEEVFISIADFKDTGNLELWEKEWAKYDPEEEKKKKK
jgi:hypothetical protein